MGRGRRGLHIGGGLGLKKKFSPYTKGRQETSAVSIFNDSAVPRLSLSTVSRPSFPPVPEALTVLLLVERAVAAAAAEGVRLGVTLTARDRSANCCLYDSRGRSLLTTREYPVTKKARPGQQSTGPSVSYLSHLQTGTALVAGVAWPPYSSG